MWLSRGERSGHGTALSRTTLASFLGGGMAEVPGSPSFLRLHCSVCRGRSVLTG